MDQSPDALATDFPEALILVVEDQQAIAGVVTLTTVGAGNEAADVHSLAVVIPGNGKAGAATARDEEHAKVFLASHLVLRRASLHFPESRVAVTPGKLPSFARLGRRRAAVAALVW